jgi:signal peptidase I
LLQFDISDFFDFGYLRTNASQKIQRFTPSQNGPDFAVVQAGTKDISKAFCPVREVKHHAELCSVPSDGYFLMGDHRISSNDSRVFGPVASRSLLGRAVFAYWPVDRFGSLSAERTAEAETK